MLPKYERATMPHYREITEPFVVAGRDVLAFAPGQIVEFRSEAEVPETLAKFSTPLPPGTVICYKQALPFDAEDYRARTAPPPPDPPKPPTYTAAQVRAKFGWTDAQWTAAQQSGFPASTLSSADGTAFWTEKQLSEYAARLEALGASVPQSKGWAR